MPTLMQSNAQEVTVRLTQTAKTDPKTATTSRPSVPAPPTPAPAPTASAASPPSPTPAATTPAPALVVVLGLHGRLHLDIMDNAKTHTLLELGVVCRSNAPEAATSFIQQGIRAAHGGGPGVA